VEITARVLDSEGNVVWSGQRPVQPDLEPGDVVVALPGEDPPTGTDRPVSVELQLSGSEPLRVAGTGAEVQVVSIAPVSDGLRLLSTGEATIYERPDALPRIRWAGTSVVEPDPERTIEMLDSGTAPGVVLERPGPVAADSSADVTVVEDSGDQIRVDVVADGDGYLVVADALMDSFHATVDGEQAELRVADHAYVAVAVPAGAHEVGLSYHRPGGYAGPFVSMLAAAVVAALVIIPWLADRRRRSAPHTSTS
jgi:hypothetical protein